MLAQRPVLLYRHTCPRCRFLSRAIVLLSGGGVRRLPNDSLEAAALYTRHGEADGKLALAHAGSLHVGRRVFAVAWWAVAWCWLVRIPLLGRRWRVGLRSQVEP